MRAPVLRVPVLLAVLVVVVPSCRARSAAAQERPVASLSAAEVEARIERLHACILPPRGTEQAEVDRVFGEPRVVTDSSGKGSRANLPLYVHELLPALPRRSFRANLLVNYREGRVRRASIDHSHVAKGRPLTRKGTPRHEQQQREIEAEQRRSLESLREIRDAFAEPLRRATWNQATNGPRFPALPAPPERLLLRQKVELPPLGVRVCPDGRLVGVKDRSEMVFVHGTEFLMGSDDGGLDERPPHRVWVSAFLVDRHEVTNAQFAQFVAETGYVTDAEKGDGGYALQGDSWARGADWRHPLGPQSSLEGRESHPVVQVSWNDAQAYARWAGKRLPTEAEFERCLRGGRDGAPYPWGGLEGPPRMFGNYADKALRAAHPGAKIAGQAIRGYDDGNARTSVVGRFTQSPLSLFDVSGNVWEWCSDRYDPEYYGSAPSRDPTGPSTGSYRVWRGGGWNSWPDKLRNSFRKATSPDYQADVLGFRCAVSVQR